MEDAAGLERRNVWAVELQTNLREGFIITEKAPTRDFSWLKAPDIAFIFNSLLPLGRYIDMDPCTTELVVSQTQIIRFGQFLLG